MVRRARPVWKNYHAVLNSRGLQFFEKESDERPVMSIDFDMLQQVRPITTVDLARVPSHDIPKIFHVIAKENDNHELDDGASHGSDKKKNMPMFNQNYFKANSSNEQKLWVTRLKAKIPKKVSEPRADISGNIPSKQSLSKP